MKKLVSLLFVLFAVASVYAAEPDSLLLAGDALRHPTFDMDNCTCKNIPLFGKVEVKSSCADFKVEVVDMCPRRCGQWEFVTGGADFSVEFVTSAADFTIEYVTSCPGVNRSKDH